MMKTFSLILPITLTAVFSSGIAQAQLVTFNTEVVEVACPPELDSNGTPGGTITLDQIKVSELGTDVGVTAGEKNFSIHLGDCGVNLPAGSLGGVYFYGVAAGIPNGNAEFGVYEGRLTGTTSDGASGWHYQILPELGTDQIDVRTAPSVTSHDGKLKTQLPKSDLLQYPNVDVSSGSGTLKYRMRYYHARSATNISSPPALIVPGTRNAAVRYIVFYL